MYAKPIETIHRGYRFRSRLRSAEWAVFFDAVGLDLSMKNKDFSWTMLSVFAGLSGYLH